MLETASVAMAVYNGERFLEQQIDSILEQLSSDDELVISYDESQDGTLSLISKYAETDGRVKIVRNAEPGVVGNFNNAIQNCCKDIIFISDQDDIWKSGKKDAMLRLLNETGADLAIHNVVHINGEGIVISKPLFEEYGIRGGGYCVTSLNHDTADAVWLFLQAQNDSSCPCLLVSSITIIGSVWSANYSERLSSTIVSFWSIDCTAVM